MSILELATASRVTGGPMLFSSLPQYPEYVDSDNTTRVIAQRVSDDAAHVIYARGAHRDIIATHNTRAKLSHERSQCVATLGDDESSDEQRADAEQRIGQLDESLKKYTKTRATPTLHVARALQHYSQTDE